MTVPLFVPLVLAAAPAGATLDDAPDPPVQVWFDQDGNYEQGDRVRVFARALRDGYMMILHADLDGRVRVLFPLDPVQDDFVRGGQTLEILGRGDEGAFAIVQPEGYGTVLAAWSPDPFYRDGFVRADHWDYRVIAANGVGDDPEAGLLDIVHAMAGGQPFDYHTAQYLVGYPVYETAPTYSISLRSDVCLGCSSWGWDRGPGFSFHLSFGTPAWAIWYDRSPWYGTYHGPARYHYDPWRWSWSVPAWRPAYWYDPWYDPWWSWRPVRYHRPGISVGIRYAGCWGDCGPRWGRPYRPGRATGVTFGTAWWTRAGGGVGTGTGIAWNGGSRGTPGQGIGRAGPTRWAVPKDNTTGRGTGTAQPSRIGETRGVVATTPPSRARSAIDNPVRTQSDPDQRIRQQAQPTRAPVVSSTPQPQRNGVSQQRPERTAVVRSGTTQSGNGVAQPPERAAVVRSGTPQTRSGVAQRPERNSVVRSGTQSPATSPQRSAVQRGVGSTNSNTRIVPEARTTNGVGTRPTERAATVRGGVIQRGSSTSPPASSRSGAGTRSGIATRSSNSNTRVVPSTRSSGPVIRSDPRTSSGVASRAQPTRSGNSTSRVVPSRPSTRTRTMPSRSGAASRAVPSRSSTGSATRVVPRASIPARSSGAASRAGATRSTGSSSRAAPTRSSGSSRSSGVASRASSSGRSSASGRASGSSRSRSGSGG